MENVEESEFSYIADGMVKVHSVWNTTLELYMKINIYKIRGAFCPPKIYLWPKDYIMLVF